MRIGSNSGLGPTFAEQRSVRAGRGVPAPTREASGEEPVAGEELRLGPPPADETADAAALEKEPAPGTRTELTDEQRAELVELQHRDAEVRAHEAAHAAAAGALGGGASFEYTTGPD